MTDEIDQKMKVDQNMVGNLIIVSLQVLPFEFSVAKATLQPPLSTKDVVILKQGCGYIQKDVVI